MQKIVEETSVVLLLDLEFTLEIHFDKQGKRNLLESASLAEIGYYKEEVAFLLQYRTSFFF